jgi:hypothetical protein
MTILFLTDRARFLTVLHQLNLTKGVDSQHTMGGGVNTCESQELDTELMLAYSGERGGSGTA